VRTPKKSAKRFRFANRASKKELKKVAARCLCGRPPSVNFAEVEKKLFSKNRFIASFLHGIAEDVKRCLIPFDLIHAARPPLFQATHLRARASQ
jgi:hypothetical protein